MFFFIIMFGETMNLDEKYLIKKTKNNTLLINKFDSDIIYKFDGVGKIIIDNINNGKTETIKILRKHYKVETKILENDYDDFINELKILDKSNILTEELTYSDLNVLLESNEVTNCMIEITNRCQFKCDHCYVDKSKKNDMDFISYKRIIDELLKINCYTVILTGGEPLLNKDFKKMYLYAKKKGMRVGINTNGFLINEEIIKLFNKYKPFQIEISIYGYDDFTYEEFTHFKNAFSVINDNIVLLINNNINLKLKTVLTKRNFDNFERIRKYCQQFDSEFRYDYNIFPKVSGGLFRRNEEALLPKDIVKIIKKNENDIKYFKNAVNNLNENIEMSDNVFQCSIGKDRIFIDCYGNIKPCLVVDEKYNIKEYKILDALNMFRNGICKLHFSTNSKCKDCYKKKLCRYCPGKFQLETGSYETAPKEYCELCELLISEFKEEFKYDFFNNDNLPKTEILLDMCQILVDNYNLINNTNDSVDNSYDIWVNMIKNTKGYNMLLCFMNHELIGFICYMYMDDGLMLSEVQIKKEYQGRYNILRKMLQQLVNNTNKDLYSDIYGTISSKNKKSQLVFKHVGFENVRGILYKININDLTKWINRSK